MNFIKNKLLWVYGIVLVLAVVLMISLYNKSRKSQDVSLRDYAEIKENGVINVVTDYNSIGYFISGDTVKGFQYELLRQLEKDWGIKVNIFLENSLDENLAGLKTKKYDIVARNIPINSVLRKNFAFTESIILNKQVLIQRKPEFNNNKELIRSHLDLVRKTIHVPKDSPAILRLKNLSHEIGDTIYVVEDPKYEAEQLVSQVASGEIDYTICSEKVASQLALKLPEIDTQTDISFTQLESWAVRKNTVDLLDSINDWFIKIQHNGIFNKLYSKYY